MSLLIRASSNTSRIFCLRIQIVHPLSIELHEDPYFVVIDERQIHPTQLYMTVSYHKYEYDAF